MAIDFATQTNRQMSLTTPLGKDKLLLVNFSGTEGVSELFHFILEVIADNRHEIAFDKLLGQKATVEIELPDKKKRPFNGIVSRISEGRRDEKFTHYRIELVPKVWTLTRRVQSRIFQHQTVIDVLKKVFDGIDVGYEQSGSFPTRDYVVQYHETDFAFASRLMEDEGICYFFKHTPDSHKMVLANLPSTFPPVMDPVSLVYDQGKGGRKEQDRITEWFKNQELRSGKYSVWDYCFEMPEKHLEAEKVVQDSVKVGSIEHKLKVAQNEKLEIYDFPGNYADHFDGVSKHGGDQAGDLQKIFQENKRKAEIRIQEEAVQGLTVDGGANARNLASGHKFKLTRHFNADGEYVLTRVTHHATMSANYRSGESTELSYSAKFTCIPLSLQYRPKRHTPKPVIPGPQTAVVVGPKGEKINVDKYGRVKVQFNWDRHGKLDADSSCWVRVSQNWGSGKYGGMFIPHIGDETVVHFEDGDPDRPLIIGRVYNAKNMPPRDLPLRKTMSIIQDQGGDYILLEGSHDGSGTGIDIVSPTGHTEINIGTAFGTNCGPDYYPKPMPVPMPFGGAKGPLDGFMFMTGLDWLQNVGKNMYVHIAADNEWLVGGKHNEQVGGLYHGEYTGTYYLDLKATQTVDIAKGQKVTVKAGGMLFDVTGGWTGTIKDGWKVNVTGGITITSTADIGITADGHAKVKSKGDMIWETLNMKKENVTGVSIKYGLSAALEYILGMKKEWIAGVKHGIILGSKSEIVLGHSFGTALWKAEYAEGKYTTKAIWKKVEAAKADTTAADIKNNGPTKTGVGATATSAT